MNDCFVSTESNQAPEKLTIEKLMQAADKVPKIIPAIIITDVAGLEIISKNIPVQKGGLIAHAFASVPVLSYETAIAKVEAANYVNKGWKVCLIIGNQVSILEQK